MPSNKVIIAYVPALHAGYITFFKKHSNVSILVLGKTFIDAYPRLNRDLRALVPYESVQALSSLSFETKLLEVDNLAPLSQYKTFILPDEDVSKDFAEKYLAGKDVHLESVFLRWDAVAANKSRPIIADRTISTDALDQELMHQAIKESTKSADWWRQIGAVLVVNGTPVAFGHTNQFPSDLALDIFGTPRITVDFGERPDLYITMHAEADVISQAAKKGITLEGASLYTSTFPCINCAYLIARSGIKKLYYAEEYSNLNAEEILKGADVEIIQVAGVQAK